MIKIKFVSAALAAALFAGPALADSSYSGTVTGNFTDEQLVGQLILTNDQYVDFSNASTAVYSNGGSTLNWGSGIQSSLTFVGASYANVLPDEVFKLGTLTYFNGSSPGNTVLFGATLRLQAGAGIDDIIEPLHFFSTLNNFSSKERDSDFITFTTFPVSFNVLEGATASVDLFGSIVGDPQFTLNDLELHSGGGFLGHGIGSPTPEPASWALMLLGFGGMGAMVRRRRALAI